MVRRTIPIATAAAVLTAVAVGAVAGSAASDPGDGSTVVGGEEMGHARSVHSRTLHPANRLRGAGVDGPPDGSVEEEHFTDGRPEPIPPVPRTTGHTTGTVRMWNDEEGWGVIDSEQTPGGCWAHYSNITGDGFRTVPVGATVVLDWEQVTDQDGYRYRATRIEQQPI